MGLDFYLMFYVVVAFIVFVTTFVVGYYTPPRVNNLFIFAALTVISFTMSVFWPIILPGLYIFISFKGFKITELKRETDSHYSDSDLPF